MPEEVYLLDYDPIPLSRLAIKYSHFIMRYKTVAGSEVFFADGLQTRISDYRFNPFHFRQFNRCDNSIGFKVIVFGRTEHFEFYF